MSHLKKKKRGKIQSKCPATGDECNNACILACDQFFTTCYVIYETVNLPFIFILIFVCTVCTNIKITLRLIKPYPLKRLLVSTHLNSHNNIKFAN